MTATGGRAALALVLATLGCGGGGNAKRDAAPSDAHDWGNVAVIGRVCTVIDFRDPYGCPPGSANGGLHVTELTSGATIDTIDDGSFGLDFQIAGPAILQVTGDVGGTRRTSLVSVPLVSGQARGVVVPSVTAPVWQQFESFLGVTDDPTRDTIIMKLVNGTAAAPGLVVIPSADTTGPVLYDNGGAFSWEQTAGTKDHGVAIVVGVPVASPASLLVRNLSRGTEATIAGLPVAAGALTFDKVDISQTSL